MGTGSSMNDPHQATVKYTPTPSPTAGRTLTDVLREYQNGRNTLNTEDVQALENFIQKNSKYVKGTDIHSTLGVAKSKQTLVSLQQERKDILNKISEIAGARLKSNNPAIADLSDQNRPSKLAEKFSELYDNEWTDATEELKERKKKEKSTEKSEEEMEITVIKLFYEITKDIYKRCKKTSEKQLEEVKTAVCLDENSEVHQKMTVELERKCREFIRTHGEVRLRQIIEKLPDEVLQEIENAEANELKISCDILKSCKRVMDFIKSCIRLCWYMNIQEPPVYMVTDVDPNSLHMFRAYTRSGDVIDYVVWPSLLLKEDGPLLYKGVAQMKKTVTTTQTNKREPVPDHNGADKDSLKEGGGTNQQDPSPLYENVQFSEQKGNEAWNGMVDKSEKQEENVPNMSPGRFVTKVNVNRAPKNEDV